MSSLAAAQADGFYRPPDWHDNAGKPSLRKFTGSKGHNQYLQSGIIRFELPYHCWCLKCKSHLGKGVRFNAKKVEAGKYFSTKIWEFQMKCPNCSNLLVIRTDPKNCDYDMVEGIKRREQEYDVEDIGLEPLPTEPSMNAVSVDPLIALEKSKDDKRKANAAAARLEELQERSSRLEEDNYGVNSMLRNSFRTEKKARKAIEEESTAKGLRFDLLPHHEEDAVEAKDFALNHARARHDNFKKDAKAKFAKIMGSSIFGDSKGEGGGTISISTSSSKNTSRALIALKKGGSTSSSKPATTAELKLQLAMKRARLGIDGSKFKTAKALKGPTVSDGARIGSSLKRKA